MKHEAARTMKSCNLYGTWIKLEVSEGNHKKKNIDGMISLICSTENKWMRKGNLEMGVKGVLDYPWPKSIGRNTKKKKGKKEKAEKDK